LAKQLGVGEQALKGLNDIDSFPFPPDEKIALRFADAMTRAAGQVDDALFSELRSLFSEPQIVELAGVIGAFNYFNRVNNALRMDITLGDPETLMMRIAELLAMAPPDPAAACDLVIELLLQGRWYGSVGIRAKEGERLVRLAHHGTEASAAQDAEGEAVLRSRATRMGASELIVPIRFGAEPVGIIEIRNNHPGLIDDKDRALVERIAGLLAPHLAAHRPPA